MTILLFLSALSHFAFGWGAKFPSIFSEPNCLSRTAALAVERGRDYRVEATARGYYREKDVQEFVRRKSQHRFLEDEANRVYYQADFAMKYLDPDYPNARSEDPPEVEHGVRLDTKMMFVGMDRFRKKDRDVRQALFYNILDMKEPKTPAEATFLANIFRLRIGITQRRAEIANAFLDLSLKPSAAVALADKALWTKVDPSLRGILAAQTPETDHKKMAAAILKSNAVPSELKLEVTRELDYLKKYGGEPHIFFHRYLEALVQYYGI